MAQFAEKLRTGRFPIALEITPPQKPRNDVVLRRARMLGAMADAVNVIQRPGRVDSLDTALELAEAGIEPVWHVVNRGRSRADLDAEIERAAAGGLRLALCIRGDHRASDAPDTPKLRELVGMVRARIPDSLVGATLNQYAPRERVLRNLFPKLAAGAVYVQTQPVLDPASLVPFVEELRSGAPGTFVVPMVMPLLTSAAADQIGERLGIPVPAALRARLERGGEPSGWEIFGETVSALAGSFADGLAVMTLQMDPAPDLTARLRAVLDRAIPRAPRSSAGRDPAPEGGGSDA